MYIQGKKFSLKVKACFAIKSNIIPAKKKNLGNFIVISVINITYYEFL